MTENRKMLLYSARKSVDNIAKAMDGNLDENENFYIIGTAMHWIVDCIERIPRKNLSAEDRKLFSALRFSNNCLKHNITFKLVHEAGGLDYPYGYMYDYGPYFKWISLDEVSISKDKENQRENYKKKLEGKNILTTLNEIITCIEKYYNTF